MAKPKRPNVRKGQDFYAVFAIGPVVVVAERRCANVWYRELDRTWGVQDEDGSTWACFVTRDRAEAMEAKRAMAADLAEDKIRCAEELIADAEALLKDLRG